MRPGDIQVKVAGRPLRLLGHVTDTEWSTRFADGPCGPDLAGCVLAIHRRDDQGFLRLGQTFEVFDRGVPVFGGRITAAGRGAQRRVEAKGWARVAFDGTITSEPGYRVGRDAENRVFTPAAETDHRWLLDAGDLDITVADDRLYTQVIATYATAVDGSGNVTTTSTQTANDTGAQGLYGVLPFELDLTPLGLDVDATAAYNYAAAQLAEFAIPEWSERVITTSTRLLTRNGTPAHLPDVKAGQKVRMFNLPLSFGGLRQPAGTDVVLGEVSYSTATPGEVTIAPARRAVRSIADVVRQAAEAKKKAEEAAKAATTMKVAS